MTTDAYKQRIRGAVESWKDAAREGRDRPRRQNKYGTEAQEQARVMAWLESRGIPVFHVPNAGARNPFTAKSQGVRGGVPDLIIPLPPPCGGYQACAVEMKRVHGGQVSMAQLEWVEKLRSCGWAARVCQGAEEAIAWLEGTLRYGGDEP